MTSWQANATRNKFPTALAIHEGDSVLFAVEGDEAIERPLKKKPLPELYGALPATRSYPGLEAVRREVQGKRAQRFERGTSFCTPTDSK